MLSDKAREAAREYTYPLAPDEQLTAESGAEAAYPIIRADVVAEVVLALKQDGAVWHQASAQYIEERFTT